METYAQWRLRVDGVGPHEDDAPLFADMGPLESELFVLATDQVGDGIVCLGPDGGLWSFTSDGDVTGPGELVEGKTLAQHLWLGLSSGLLYLARP